MSDPFLSSEDYDERAHECYDAGDYDQALALLHEGLSLYPAAADLHVGIGYVRMAREEYAWARQSFEAGLAIETDHEDAWVGLGEALLKFGELDAAMRCFTRLDELELEDDLDLGLAIGRALYREGMFRESRERLRLLAARYADSAEVHAALGYTRHALGEEAGAVQELRCALRLEPDFHEARIYLGHLLYERADHQAALRELDRVPPSEHWDSLSLWRVIELKIAHQGITDEDDRLAPWRERLGEIECEPDAIDHLLAEVEAAFVHDEAEPEPAPALPRDCHDGRRLASGVTCERPASTREAKHRVRTREGDLYIGTWEQIVQSMQDRTSDAGEPIVLFMYRAAQRIRRITGCELPHHDAEAFVRASATLGLLEIED